MIIQGPRPACNCTKSAICLDLKIIETDTKVVLKEVLNLTVCNSHFLNVPFAIKVPKLYPDVKK